MADAAPDDASDDRAGAVADDPPEERYARGGLPVPRTGPDLQPGDDAQVDTSESLWMQAMRVGDRPTDLWSEAELAIGEEIELEARLAESPPARRSGATGPARDEAAPDEGSAERGSTRSDGRPGRRPRQATRQAKHRRRPGTTGLPPHRPTPERLDRVPCVRHRSFAVRALGRPGGDRRLVIRPGGLTSPAARTRHRDRFSRVVPDGAKRYGRSREIHDKT